jgi:hypothetical protein
MRDPAITQLIALVAFGGTYLGLALGHLPFFRVDRTGVAIIGAALMLVAESSPGMARWPRWMCTRSPCSSA